MKKSLADCYSMKPHSTKKVEPAAIRVVTETPDDGLGMLRRVAAMSHGKRKAEYDAALKKHDDKKK